MSRKDYLAIVGILNEYTGDGNGPGSLFEHSKFDRMVEQLAAMFANDNPNFDRARFYAAVTEYSPNWE